MTTLIVGFFVPLIRTAYPTCPWGFSPQGFMATLMDGNRTMNATDHCDPTKSTTERECLVGDVSVTLETSRAIDPETAQRSIGIAGVDGVVRLQAGGKRATWKPLRPLPPGRYRFTVGELANGARLNTSAVVPFSVVHSKARETAAG